MNDKIDEKEIIKFITEIENRPAIWSYRRKDSYKTKQKAMEEVADIFNVPGKRFICQH
jgi:hypothetical protein